MPNRAVAADPADTDVAAVLAVVTGQAHYLRPATPLGQPGYILRQLGMQAGELGEDCLAGDIRARLKSRPGLSLLPVWTTGRASRALDGELGRHHPGGAWAMAVLADGRLVTGGGDKRLLGWNPYLTGSSSGPVELGRCPDSVRGMAVLADGRLLTSGSSGHVLVWDPAVPFNRPIELGRHDGSLREAAVLADGRVVTGSLDGHVLVWDPDDSGRGPALLGSHSGPAERGGFRLPVWDVAVLADGRVISAGDDRRILIFDPAAPRRGPLELSRDTKVGGLAPLTNGLVLTGGDDGRLLAWDPAAPDRGAAELARHKSPIWEVTVLADARVIIIGATDGCLATPAGLPPVLPACTARQLPPRRFTDLVSVARSVKPHDGDGTGTARAKPSGPPWSLSITHGAQSSTSGFPGCSPGVLPQNHWPWNALDRPGGLPRRLPSPACDPRRERDHRGTPPGPAARPARHYDRLHATRTG